MTLRISLRDGEKMIVNGAVIRSLGRSNIQLENHAAILRGREVMAPEEANTPARRLYFACMMAYIDTDARETHQDAILTLLSDLLRALEAPEAKAACASLAHNLALSDYYRALADCRVLISYEAEVLGRLETQAA
jgi:flagellar protein FlbT